MAASGRVFGTIGAVLVGAFSGCSLVLDLSDPKEVATPGEDANPAPDTGVGDAGIGNDGAVNQTPETAVDAPIEAAADAAEDGAWDGTIDSSTEPAPDASIDGSTDGGLEASLDATVDAAPDATVDAAPDAAVDAALDATVDAAPDAMGDGGSDAFVDAGSDATACTPESDIAMCSRFGKDCGSITDLDNCGAQRTVSGCGTCVTPQTCSANGVCACVPETDAAFCMRYGKSCGSLVNLDSCGRQRTVPSCGTCQTSQTCNAQGTCQGATCTPETDPAFCTRFGKNCGSLTNLDNCGAQRTVSSCGACPIPQTCGAVTANECGCVAEANTAFCLRLNKACGSWTGTDNCGAQRTVSNCGTCQVPQSCGVVTPNQCGCVPKTCTQQGAACGSVLDDCGGTLSCGTCAPPQTCGAVTANQCGCVAETNPEFCARLGKNCDSVTANDNCGTQRTVSNCGPCQSPDSCGQVIPNVCGLPSCFGGLDCGGLSCCDRKTLPAATFGMGRGSSGVENDVCASGAWAYAKCSANEQPQHDVTLSALSLDTYEVTVGRFRKFVTAYPGNKPTAGAGANPNLTGSGWDTAWDSSLPSDQAALISALKCHATYLTWTDLPGSNENKPINCTSWHVAFAFCAWDGGRLPTEAEWEYAASGGEDRALPWTSGATAPDTSHAVFGVASLAVVGSVPNGVAKWGQHDMAGNVYEWTLDWYAAYPVGACTNCANLVPATYRVTRGGSFLLGQEHTRAEHRNTGSQSANSSIGVRCARNP